MRYLTAKEILVLHALVVDSTSGSHGIRDVQLLASIIHKPQSRFGGKDLYSGVFKKAAVLFEAIANYHVFIDGNKRTALAAAARSLHINGYVLTANNADTEEVALAVATKEIDVEALAAWLKEHSKKIKKQDSISR